MSPQVEDQPEKTRYLLTVDGKEAGFAVYRDVDGARVFTHTEVSPDLEGQGLGTTLISEALEHVKGEGHRIVPLCPFVRRYVEEHPELGELVDDELYSRLRG